jgi:CHAT domain-containing protein
VRRSSQYAATIDETTTTHEYRVRATVRQWLGYELLNLGYFGDALAVLRQSSDEGRAFGNLAAVGWSELNIAALLNRVGDRAGARRHILRSRDALSASRDSSGLGILGRIEGSVALALGDTATARTRGIEALHAAQQSGRAPDILAAHTALAVVDVHEQRWDAALAELSAERQIVARYRVPHWAPSISALEGRVLLDAGQPRRALAHLRDAFRGFDSTQHLYRYGLCEAIADARLHVGDTTGAVDALIRANRLLDAWRATLSDADLRVLAYQATDITGDADAGSSDVIAAAAVSGRTTVAFVLTEWRRARELIDQIDRANTLRLSGAALASSEPSPGSVRGEDSPRTGEGGATNGVSVTLSGLQRAIPDDSTAVLEYVAGPPRVPTTLFVVTRRQAWAHELSPVTSLADEIERLDASIEDNVSTDVVARVLGDRVIQPAIADLPARIVRLVIIPDGALHRIPFAALRIHDGRPLVERFAISLAPSATVVAALWHRPQIVREATILAFGDPVQPSEAALAGRTGERGADASVDSSGTGAPPSLVPNSVAIDTNAALDRDAASALDATGGLPRLLWTADEARLVGEFSTQSMVRLRGDASAAYLQTAPLERFTVLHFATHSVVDDVTPTRSALVLAPGVGRTGFVGPADLQALHLTADLVVLSACRSARGAVVAGEGVRGLTAPLLAAGARSILATQWRLGDRAAVPLVYAIYQGLAAGLPLADAVQQAEVAARRRGAPVREWAVFTAVGDGTVRVPLHLPRPDRVPAWLSHGE